jgi:hypothetical protein
MEDRSTGTMASLPLAQNDLPFPVQDDDSDSYSWIHYEQSTAKIGGLKLDGDLSAGAPFMWNICSTAFW